MTKVCEHKLRPTFKDNIIFETDAEKQNDDGSEETVNISRKKSSSGSAYNLNLQVLKSRLIKLSKNQ